MRVTGGGLHSEVVEFYNGITSREKDVLEELAMGHSNPLIASRLCISVRTVGRHMGVLRSKYMDYTNLNPAAIDCRVLLASVYWEMQELEGVV